MYIKISKSGFACVQFSKNSALRIFGIALLVSRSLKFFYRATVAFLLTKVPAERIFMVQVPADRALGPNQQFPVQYPASSPDCNLCDSFCFGNNEVFFIHYLLSIWFPHPNRPCLKEKQAM